MYTGHVGDEVNFLMASSLYHPDTVERSLKHDGSGDEPGLKDPDGNWDLRPHRERIIDVTDETLRIWHAIMEDDSVPVRQTRMVYTVNRAAAEVLATLARQPRAGVARPGVLARLARVDRPQERLLRIRWGAPRSWDDVILQGPHLYVATPMYKSPNPTMKNNQDWSATDFESAARRRHSRDRVQACRQPDRYDADYTHWDSGPARALLPGRLASAWRRTRASER